MRKLRITIEGRSYDVSVEELDGEGAAAAPVSAATPPAIPTMVVKSRASAPAPKDELVLAPINGTIVKVEVEEGATAAHGQPLVIIESMKMHFPVPAPRSGKVSGIRVTAGEAVEEGQLLMMLG